MEVKIKQGNEMIDATIEMGDGVMVVSPKEEKVDVTKFKDGDVITCGSECDGGLSWTFILKGEIDYFHDDYKFAEEYVSLDSNGSFEVGSYSDAIKWFRPATEGEKQELFDKLKEEGYEWDAERKELVKLKWMPKCYDIYYFPCLKPDGGKVEFFTKSHTYLEELFDKNIINAGWYFETKEECQVFCDKLNETLSSVKP